MLRISCIVLMLWFLWAVGEETRQEASSQDTLVVRTGDTVFSLAQSVGLSVEEFAYINNLTPPYLIYPDQELRYTKYQTYEIVKGDTLFTIAKKFHVALEALHKRNGLKKGEKIYPLQVLILPPTKATTPLKKESVSVSAGLLETGVLVPIFRPFFLHWPVAGEVVKKFHKKNARGVVSQGIIIEVNKGKTVQAAAAGQVVFVGNQIATFGNLVMIKHDKGYTTVYAHMRKIMVTRGDIVSMGDNIGTLAPIEDHTKLHFQLRHRNLPLDPLLYFNTFF